MSETVTVSIKGVSHWRDTAGTWWFRTIGGDSYKSPHTVCAYLDALATRERELAEARADLAAVEAVERFRKRQDAGVMINALRLSSWTDADGKLAEAPTLVALGRALLAREADDATR